MSPTDRGARALTALLAALGLAGCPARSGSLGDDDDSGRDDDDGGDDDGGDDDAGDDDATALPAMQGELLHVGGPIPPGTVRVGAFLASEGEGIAQERFSVAVADTLGTGATAYALPLPVPDDADLADMDDGDGRAAYYGLFAYVDRDGDGERDPGDRLLGSSPLFVGYLDVATPPPDPVQRWGGGAGWNIMDFEALEAGQAGLTPIPDGTAPGEGLLISLDLVPVVDVTLAVGGGDLVFEQPARLTALHNTLFEGAPVDGFELTSVPAAPGAPLRLPLGGPPPPAHVSSFGGGGLEGAFYFVGVYFDDGDGAFRPGTCDRPRAIGEGRFLSWLDPDALDPSTAWTVQRLDATTGWSLYDADLEFWIPITLGLQLSAVGDPIPPACLSD